MSAVLCECGCGEAAPIAKVTRSERGQVKGEPIRFVHGHNGRIHPYTMSRLEYKREWARKDRRRSPRRP